MAGCLNDEQAQGLAAGALADDIAAPLLAHIGRCDACRVLVAVLARGHPAVGHPRTASSPLTSARALAAGASIDRYVVEALIGAGGMGVVYRAYDPQLDRRVALKLVRTDGTHSAELRERLVREAQVMARVVHDNVLTVYDAGDVGEQVFVAMELVNGSTLGEWLRQHVRPWRSVVATFVRAGRGLATAHALGIVHRDFKPDNVLVGSDGRVRVSDFGLAVVASLDARAPVNGGESSPQLTATAPLVGTPAYMAPEQRRGAAVDARSDQYSFCVALYEAIAGARPSIDATGELRIVPRKTAPRRCIPAGVYRVIARGLSLSPSARYAAMEPLIAALEREAGGGRRRARVATGLLCAGAAIGLVGLRRARDDPAAPLATVRSVHRLSYALGCEEYPSLAKDGVVVFDGDADGAQQLFALELHTGRTRQLTTAPGSHRAPLVSPDGTRVAYEHQVDGLRQLRLRRLDDEGAIRDLGTGSTLGGSWLDDHRLLLAGAGGTLVTLDVDEAAPAPRPLGSDVDHHRFGLTAPFSDGAIAVSWWSPPNGLGIGVKRGAELRVLVERMPYTDGALVVAPDDDAFYYVRRAGATNELVRQPRGQGEPSVVGGGIAPARGFAIARDGRALVFSTCTSRTQLIRLGDDGATPIFRAQPWSDTAPSPIDAHRLLFASDRSGHDRLYVADLASDGAPIAFGDHDVEEGVPSPDGRFVVYAAHDPGGVWLAPLDGSDPPRRLTDGAHDEAPQFARDGHSIYFVRAEAIYAVPTTGGEPRLVARPGHEPVPSRVDGRLFFLLRATALARQRVMVVDEHGTVAPLDLALPPGNYWSLTVAPDAKRLALVREGHEVIEVTLDGSAPRVRMQLSRWISSMHYSFDGSTLLCSAELLDGDLWLAEGRFH